MVSHLVATCKLFSLVGLIIKLTWLTAGFMLATLSTSSRFGTPKFDTPMLLASPKDFARSISFQASGMLLILDTE